MTNKWHLTGKVHSSRYRKEVLIKLLEGARTPTGLSKELKIKMSHISRALKELGDMKLIKCLTPELRKSKIYSITNQGGEILKLLKNYH